MRELGRSPEQQLAVPDRDGTSTYPHHYPLEYGEQGEVQGQGLNLRDFLEILRRRRAIAINSFVLVVVMGVVLTLITTPKFSTTARILVEGKTQTVAISDTKDPMSTLFMPALGHDVNTQVEILRGPALQTRVYNESAIPIGAVVMDARQVGTTDLIDITVTSTSRDHATKFATALPEVYLEQVRGQRVAELRAALDFARRRLQEHTTELTIAETALQNFKQKVGVASPEDERTSAIESAAEARAAASAAQAELASAQGRLAALQSARGSLSEFLDTPVTTTNPDIRALQQNIDELRSERSRMLFQYNPNSDEIRRIDLQIAEAQRRLANAPRTVTTVNRAPNPAISNLETQITEARTAVRAATATANTLRARVKEVGTGISRFNPIERTVSGLQRQVDDARAAVSTFKNSVEDLTLREQVVTAKNNPVTVIAAAGPARQISPNVMRNIIMAVMLGVIFACGMALLQNSLDDHVNDEDEARRLLPVPVLGYLPMIPSDTTADGKRPVLSLSHSDPALTESFRMLRSNVRFSLLNGPHQTLLVTSTVPAEGKTTTASNLAVAMALEGKRVLLIDADMRRPSIDAVFGLSRQPGLSNVLVGQTPWREVLHNHETPGLRIMTAGALPPNPAELLSSPALDVLMEDMKAEVDMVIFDTPPCPATADTQVLASKVDGVLYVMHLGKVRKAGVMHAFSLLRQANARILGITFNKFEARAGYGYYYGYGNYGEHEGEDSANGTASHNGNGVAVSTLSVPAAVGSSADEGDTLDQRNSGSGSGHHGHEDRNGSSKR